MKNVVAILVALSFVGLVGCESKPDPAKPAATTTSAATAPSPTATATSTSEAGW